MFGSARFANAITVALGSAGALGAVALLLVFPDVPLDATAAGVWQAYAGLWAVVVAAWGFAALVRYVFDTNRLANQGAQTLQATNRTLQATMRMELAKLNVEVNRSLLDHAQVLKSLAECPVDQTLTFTRPEHQMAGVLLNYLEVVWHQSQVFDDARAEWGPWEKVLQELLWLPCVGLYWTVEREAYSQSFRDHVDRLDRYGKAGISPVATV